MSLFAKTQETYKNIEGEELSDLISRGEIAGSQVIDVRTEGEHNSGHIPGSVNINVMDPQFVSKLEGLDRDKNYYVYCASGNRSRTASSQMIYMGFKNVHNVLMGIMGWPGDIE